MEEKIEEKFEKKSSKKVAITISIIVILLIVAVVAGFFYLSYTRKPEQIFSKAVSEVFEPLEKDSSEKRAKIDLELSMEMESNDFEVAMANEMLKSAKIKSTTEIDLDKKIFNENLGISYAGQEIISADALIQNEKMYFYLNEIYSKYIEVPEEYYGGEDLSTIFETNTEISEEELVNDIKQILLDEIDAREFVKENVELNGENVQKSTLKLTPKEILEITVKILEKYNEYVPTEEKAELIEDLKTEIEYSEDTENYLDISIYTKGLKNELVRAEIVMVDKELEEAICIQASKEAENTMIIKFLINEQASNINGATEMFIITIKEADENKGTAELKMENVDDDMSITIKIKYAIDYNATIEDKNTSNSISIDNLTDEDYAEMYENIEKNPILYSIVEQFISVKEDNFDDEVDDFSSNDKYLEDYMYDEEYLEDYIYDYVY